MTPKQISENAQNLLSKLYSLAKIQIGVGNYHDVMRSYQILLKGVIQNQQALADIVETLLVPTVVEKPLAKEK